jgi:hypothetical protein
VLCVGATAVAAVATEEHVVRREVSLGGGHGTVAVDVPSNWEFESFPQDSPPSATVRFGPASDDFDFRLGFLWQEPGMRIPLKTVKERVRIAANDALLKSVETEANLVEVRGDETAGYYYSLTDKFPGKRAGGYPYLTQGIAMTGPVTNVFTLFSRVADPAERERALRMIASARWSDAPPTAPPEPPPAASAPASAALAPPPTASAPPPAASAPPSAAPAPLAAAPAAPRTPAAPPPAALAQDLVSVRIDGSTDSYLLTDPVSHVVLTVRKGTWKRAANPTNASPGYFLLRDREHGTVASGWIESSEHFEGIEKLWERESSALKQKSSPPPEEVKFTKVGGWDAIVYHQSAPGGTSAHVRAEWVVEGTWVDLHLSTTGKRPAAEARADLLRQLEAFRVEDKD